jgi:hypothetical protein
MILSGQRIERMTLSNGTLCHGCTCARRQNRPSISWKYCLLPEQRLSPQPSRSASDWPPNMSDLLLPGRRCASLAGDLACQTAALLVNCRPESSARSSVRPLASDRRPRQAGGNRASLVRCYAAGSAEPSAAGVTASVCKPRPGPQEYRGPFGRRTARSRPCSREDLVVPLAR